MLLLLRDVFFLGRDEGLTFHPMTCLERCKQTVRLEQNDAPHGSFKEELKNRFQSLKTHAGKFPLGTTSLTTVVRDQDDNTGTKPSGVTSWKKITSEQAWEYYRNASNDEAAALEKKADKLTMSCLYIKGCNNLEMLKTLTAQYPVGNINFPPQIGKLL